MERIGQRQRVNIARALYYNADIILLDDPLSAVDAHVGKHLFDEAIRGALKDKTRILVTHALHFLPACDYIICIEAGQITQQGTYAGLMAESSSFYHDQRVWRCYRGRRGEGGGVDGREGRGEGGSAGNEESVDARRRANHRCCLGNGLSSIFTRCEGSHYGTAPSRVVGAHARIASFGIVLARLVAARVCLAAPLLIVPN